MEKVKVLKFIGDAYCIDWHKTSWQEENLSARKQYKLLALVTVSFPLYFLLSKSSLTALIHSHLVSLQLCARLYF